MSGVDRDRAQFVLVGEHDVRALFVRLASLARIPAATSFLLMLLLSRIFSDEDVEQFK